MRTPEAAIRLDGAFGYRASAPIVKKFRAVPA
jgi:hypothetical protein